MDFRHPTGSPRGVLAEVRPPAFTPGRNEDRLIGPSQGLQFRTAGQFENVVLGQHGDPGSMYVWTIDRRGINVALEKTPFDTERGNIVHTNLSEQASIGGEVWFG